MGGTPLIRLNRVASGSRASIIAKLENFYPLWSVKDRIGRAMIEAGEREEKIGLDTIVIERPKRGEFLTLGSVEGLRKAVIKGRYHSELSDLQNQFDVAIEPQIITHDKEYRDAIVKNWGNFAHTNSVAIHAEDQARLVYSNADFAVWYALQTEQWLT